MQTIVQWLLIVATAALMFVLKKLHLGVTHYNLFLVILIAWCLAVILVLRLSTADRRSAIEN